MASAFLRNSSLRQICYSFNSRFLSSKFRSLPEKSLQNSPLASLFPENLAGNQRELLRAFSTNHRFLCTNAANPGANQSAGSNANAAAQPVGSAEGSSGNKNDGGQSSGGSQSTQEQGKSVRGGVYLILFLFVNYFCSIENYASISFR